jgi:nucleotide-binding universal stress UspA family protein
MAIILCATRGGEASIQTQTRAIAIAKEQDAEIRFLYVADVQFSGNLPGSIMRDVAAELENMGEFLLQKAKERAQKEGVIASTVVKHGNFRSALVEAAREAEASRIVLGSPGETSVLQREYLEKLAADITKQSGVETVIV